MKIAVLTDAHANLPALDAALRAIAREGVDALYHLGDAIGIGPSPAECLDRLLSTPNLRLLMGNHDAWFAHGLPDPRPTWMSTGELAHHRWVHAQLDPALRPVVAAWPTAIRPEIADVPVAFLHYALDPSGDGLRSVVPNPTPTDLDRLFAGEHAALVCYGHHHPASDLTGSARYVNPGALGCSSEPLTRFLLVTFTAGAYRLEHRAAPYNPAPLFRAFAERAVPERDFIVRTFFGKMGAATVQNRGPTREGATRR